MLWPVQPGLTPVHCRDFAAPYVTLQELGISFGYRERLLQVPSRCGKACIGHDEESADPANG